MSLPRSSSRRRAALLLLALTGCSHAHYRAAGDEAPAPSAPNTKAAPASPAPRKDGLMPAVVPSAPRPSTAPPASQPLVAAPGAPAAPQPSPAAATTPAPQAVRADASDAGAQTRPFPSIGKALDIASTERSYAQAGIGFVTRPDGALVLRTPVAFIGDEANLSERERVMFTEFGRSLARHAASHPVRVSVVAQTDNLVDQVYAVRLSILRADAIAAVVRAGVNAVNEHALVTITSHALGVTDVEPSTTGSSGRTVVTLIVEPPSAP
jgi:hypothetical protein